MLLTLFVILLCYGRWRKGDVGNEQEMRGNDFSARCSAPEKQQGAFEDFKGANQVYCHNGQFLNQGMCNEPTRLQQSGPNAHGDVRLTTHEGLEDALGRHRVHNGFRVDLLQL